MNVIDSLAISIFPSMQGDKEVLAEVRQATLRYIMRFINAARFDRIMKDLSPEAAKSCYGKYRQAVHSNGYVMLNLKQYMLEAVAKGYDGTNIAELKKLAASVQVKRSDMSLGKYLRGTFLSELKSMVKKYHILPLAAWEKSVEQLLVSHAAYIGRAVNAKLRFLSTSQSTDLSEFESDVQLHVVQKMYFMYPRIDDAKHASNMAKLFTQQRIKNIISEGTAEKRARLKSTDTGYESNTADIAAVIVSSEHATHDNLCVGLTGDHRDESHFVLKSSVAHMLSQYTGKKRLFLQLLMGDEHEGFSKWLRQKLNIKATSTNTDWQERTEPTTYLNAVIKYLNLTIDRVAPFVRKIMSVLGITSNPIIDVTPRVRPMFA